MGWNDRITVTTDPHARRGDAGDCAIARPLRQVYGGAWSVTQSGAVQTDGAGRRKAYRLTALDRLRMAAFNAGLPMGRRRVTLTSRRRWHVLLLLPLAVTAWGVGWVLAAGLWWTLPVAAWCAAGLAVMVARWPRLSVSQDEERDLHRHERPRGEPRIQQDHTRQDRGAQHPPVPGPLVRSEVGHEVGDGGDDVRVVFGEQHEGTDPVARGGAATAARPSLVKARVTRSTG